MNAELTKAAVPRSPSGRRSRLADPFEVHDGVAVVELPMSLLVDLAAVLPNEASRLRAVVASPGAMRLWLVRNAALAAEVDVVRAFDLTATAEALDVLVERLTATLARHYEEQGEGA